MPEAVKSMLMAQPGDPLVSTIVPTYNRSRPLKRAVQSALEQSYASHEVIVVDDGSTDDTRAALERDFAGRIRYFYKANGGVSSARNLGLAEARGELFCFLDSDDEWHVDKVARQVAYLQANPEVAMVLTDYTWVDPSGQSIRIQHRRSALPRDGFILEHVLADPAMVPSTAMLRRSLYDAIGGFDTDLRTAEDIDFYLRAASRFGIGLVEQPLTRYMAGHESLSKPRGAYTDYARVMERFVTTEPSLDPEQRRAVLFRTYNRCARGLIWMGEPLAAARFAVRAARQARDPGELRKLSWTVCSLFYHVARVEVGAFG